MQLLRPTNSKISNLDLLKSSSASTARFRAESGMTRAAMHRIVLDVITVLSAGAFGFSAARYFWGTMPLWVVLVVLAVYSIVASLSAILTVSFARRAIVLALSAVLMVFVLIAIQPLLALGMAVVAFLLTLAAEASMRYVRANSLRIRFFSLSRSYISTIVTVGVLFVLALYGPGVVSGTTPLVAPERFARFFDGVPVLLHQLYPALPRSAVVGDLATSMARQQVGQNPAFAALTPEQQQLALSKAGNEIIKQVADQARVTVDPRDTISGVFYSIFQRVTNEWRSQYGVLFVIAWLAAVFLLIRSIGLTFALVAAALAYLVYEVCIATGIIVLQGENALRETAVLP